MAEYGWNKDQFERDLHDEIHDKIHDRIDEKKRRLDEKMRRRACGSHRSGAGGVVVGGVIVLVGILLLLSNMGILRAGDIWRYWPIILIAVGLGRIGESRRPAAILWGGIIGLIGLVFLLDNLGIVTFSFNLIWPLVIVAFGLSMLFRARDRSQMMGAWSTSDSPTPGMYAVFGGGRRRIDSQDFRTAEVFALFGGFHIDMRGAKIPSGRGVIEINAIFGGVELMVPESWHVSVQGTGVFGAFEDKTIPPRPDVGVVPPELVVTGSAVFGGATIRN